MVKAVLPRLVSTQAARLLRQDDKTDHLPERWELAVADFSRSVYRLEFSPTCPQRETTTKAHTGSPGDRTGGMELQGCVLSHWKPGSARPNSLSGTVLSATHGSPKPLLSNIQSWYTALTLYCAYFFTPVPSKKFLEASDYVLLPNTLPEPSCTLTERWLQDSCVLTEQEALLKTGRWGNVHVCDDRMGGLRGLHLYFLGTDKLAERERE